MQRQQTTTKYICLYLKHTPSSSSKKKTSKREKRLLEPFETSRSTHRLIVSFACACCTSSFFTQKDATLGIILSSGSSSSGCDILCQASVCLLYFLSRIFCSSNYIIFISKDKNSIIFSLIKKWHHHHRPLRRRLLLNGASIVPPVALPPLESR